ncbi:MAG: 2-dehydropantoate 2-reductase [Desulfitobacteriaceae bacterium]|nr:2-dehydropantoate 2-reductase [Desulfitobacteriaceae bacterium]
MKFTVIGAGAIGGVIGAYLAKGSRDVELVDVALEHIKILNDQGIKIIAQDKTFVVPVKAYTPQQLLDKKEMLECVLLCVKAQFTKDALQPLLPLMDENTFVVSVQNGLCELEIAELVGRERTVGGFVNIFSDYLEPGVISYGGKGALSIGELDGSVSPRLNAMKEEMAVLDRIVISDNVTGFLWAKLAYGAILTATALTNEEMAAVFDNPRYRVMLMDLAAEVLKVADYAGVKTTAFDDWNPADAYPRETRDLERMSRQLDIHVKRLRGYTKVHSGIWRDIAVRKRKTEKPYHFIPVFKLAEEAKIEMPLCRLLLEMLNELENGTRSFSLDNLEILLKKDNEIYN